MISGILCNNLDKKVPYHKFALIKAVLGWGEDWATVCATLLWWKEMHNVCVKNCIFFVYATYSLSEIGSFHKLFSLNPFGKPQRHNLMLFSCSFSRCNLIKINTTVHFEDLNSPLLVDKVNAAAENRILCSAATQTGTGKLGDILVSHASKTQVM